MAKHEEIQDGRIEEKEQQQSIGYPSIDESVEILKTNRELSSPISLGKASCQTKDKIEQESNDWDDLDDFQDVKRP